MCVTCSSARATTSVVGAEELDESVGHLPRVSGAHGHPRHTEVMQRPTTAAAIVETGRPPAAVRNGVTY
jgi:hypothetical protein